MNLVDALSAGARDRKSNEQKQQGKILQEHFLAGERGILGIARSHNATLGKGATAPDSTGFAVIYSQGQRGPRGLEGTRPHFYVY